MSIDICHHRVPKWAAIVAQRDERGKNNATLKVVVGAAAVKREQPATFAVNVQILHREIKANKKGSALAKAHSEAELGEGIFAYTRYRL